MQNTDELISGIQTTTFAGVVMAAYVNATQHHENRFASNYIDMLALVVFSGLSKHKLCRLRDCDGSRDFESRRVGNSIYYSPTKWALAKALAESLEIGAGEKAIHNDMQRHCRT